ncbi:MAG: CHASE domain-containing protein [Stagnimonas sp.]|nr:CHASE domain-containing protein [Stagnimonas sp.]
MIPGRRETRHQALLLLLLGSALAVAGSSWLAERNEAAREQRFSDQVQGFRDQLLERMRLYEYGVHGARGAVLGAGGASISYARFLEYCQSREPEREFPGARGFGFIRRVDPAQREQFLAKARAEQGPGFAIHQLGPNPGELDVIEFVEPRAGNRAAIGLDIASEPQRRAAAFAALRSGQPRMTAPLTLVQARNQPDGGFLLLLPVYPAGLAPAEPGERERLGLGWTYTPLLIDEVLHGMSEQHPDVAFQLTDITEGQDRPAFFGGDADHPAAAGALRLSLELRLYGRVWRLAATGLPGFAAELPLLSPWALLLGGLLASLLSASLFYTLRLTGLRREQQKLEQQQLARGIFDTSPEAIVVVDAAGILVLANGRVRDIFGHDPAALIGQSIELLLPAASRARHRHHRASYDHSVRLMSARQDLRALHADGHEFPAQVHLSPIRLDQRRLVVAAVTDVSEERASVQRLKDGEARWRQLANSMPQLVWTCAPDGACDFLSERWLRYTGMPEPEQLGAGWLRQVHPDDREALSTRWQQAVDSLSSFHVEFRIRRHDGEYRWFDTQAVPQLDERGQLLRWVGANTDIEDRKHAEQQLRELNTTLESRVAERTELLARARTDLENILNSLPSMIGYWDHREINRFANHAYRVWFGVDPEKLPGTHMRDLLGPELYQENKVYIDRALAGEEQQFERKLGQRYSLARYIPDRQGGEIRGFYAFVTDVTDIREAGEAAQAANLAKSAFLANMSHEIRTPMNAVMNLTYLLERSGLSDPQRDLVSKVKIASRSLLGLINDVLDLSKIEAGQMGLVNEAFSLGALIDDLSKVMGDQAALKRIEFAAELQKGLPSYLRGDSLRLNQVLTNLLSNAIKFTERGSVRLEIRQLAQTAELVRLRFSVFDTGIGIEAEALGKLFSPFSQADASTTRRYGGTGLGLAIVKRLVEHMDGSLGVDSTPGQGSCFWFELSLKPESEGTIAANAPQVLDALVVDDSQVDRGAICSTARSLGWRPESADDAETALQQLSDRLASGRPYDALIVDWLMPGVDGLEMLAELHRRHQGIEIPAVVLVTGGDRDALRVSEHIDLADAVLSKPVNASTLFNAVHEAVARHTKAGGRQIDTSRMSAGAGMRLVGVRALIVDDSSVNLDVGQQILEREGARVVLAVNGQQALEIVREEGGRLDVILMDVQMPVLDGNEATRQIRHELGLTSLPIIALTAGALVSERQRAIEAGMNDFISKPFDAEVMIASIRRHVEKARGRFLPLVTRAHREPESGPQLPQIAGLDLAAASSRLDGDLKLLRSLLRRMFEEFSSFGPAEFPTSDEEGRRWLAQRAHKLRGVAGNVGANQVHSIAMELESCARDPSCQDCLALLHHAAEAMDQLRMACRDFLQESPDAPTPEPAASEPTLADEDLAELRRQLARNSLSALDQLDRIDAGLKTRLGAERHGRLRAAADALRFTEALAVLSEPVGP